MLFDRRPGLMAGAFILFVAAGADADSVLRYEGNDLEMVVGTSSAQMAVGEESWLVLHVGVTGARRIATRLDREGLTLRLPDGKMLPLASQSELARSFDELEPFLRRAVIAGPPVHYYVGSRAPCAVPFFAEPNRGIVSEALFVNDRQFCTGFIYFYTDELVQPGRYELHVATRTGSGSVSFELFAERSEP